MTTLAPHPATSAGGSPAPADDRFQFHPRVTNPELWRTTLPLVVYERCGGHKGLIATWMAIHWLIVLHAAQGRRDFGVREIAARACVGRNELTGPRGYIQRLVDLGLLQIVGYDDRGRQFRAPRPIYHLDLWELERLSLELIPDVLRTQGVAPPPRPAPDPRQTSFLAAIDGVHETGTGPQPHPTPSVPGLPAQLGVGPRAVHENGTAAKRAMHGVSRVHTNGTAALSPIHPTLMAAHGNGTAWTENGTAPVLLQGSTHQNGTVGAENGTANPPTVPGVAQNRDVERERERENEGASDSAHTRMLLQEVAAQAAQVVLTALQQQGVVTAPRMRPVVAPAAPEGYPPLPDDLDALWQGDRGAVSARERHQLAMLAAELDESAGGYGAYWVGRAILIADRCLAERGQPLSVNYLRSMLRRWQREGSWGSDLEGEAGEALGSLPVATPAGPRGTPPTRPTRADDPTAAAPTPAAPPHPAVVAYVDAFGRTPNGVQAQQIAETVADLTTWRQVLTDWQAHGWKEGAVANMLDRYRKEAAPAADDGPPPSVGAIHTYPGLAPEQRDRWIRKFHAAATPAEKRAVLNRLEQEHPR